jgi:predicted acyltransferase
MATAGSESARLASLDQFRGYTVLGMFFVNFVGGFAVIPAVFKHHHTYCSYADTIMPQFFFAVGFAYRLTLLRRLKSSGPRAAYLHVLRRNLGLILLGIVVHHLGGGVNSWAELKQLTPGKFAMQAFFKRAPFETLVHIGVTSLWVLPVIGAGPAVRVFFAAASGLLHLGLSAWFNYAWVLSEPVGIDGGPLGFLTWTIPLLAGSVTYDLVYSKRGPTFRILWLAAAGAVLMAAGYALSCLTPPPLGAADRLATPPLVGFTEARRTILITQAIAAQGLAFSGPAAPAVPQAAVALRVASGGSYDLWTMSQRAGSLSYLTFAAGFSLALYALFYLLCDVAGWRLGLFGTLGSNALVGYILHDMVDNALSPYAPGDSPIWYVLLLLSIYLAVCWLFLRKLEKDKLFVRL